MQKTYKFTKQSVTTVIVDNDCECESADPCKTCNEQAWGDFEDGNGVTVKKPIDWEVA
jgi:hypothetical protein